ncbi:unnamed protein product [Rotaria socialis]
MANVLLGFFPFPIRCAFYISKTYLIFALVCLTWYKLICINSFEHYMAHSNRRENVSSVTDVANVPQTGFNQVWRYSNINNVKVVYNSIDAQNYLRAVASGWGVDESSEIGRNFLNDVRKATGQHHPVAKHPSIFEYPMETEHETRYMLIVIYAKEDRIEIGYSYHYMTNQALAKCRDPMIPNRYSIQWLREKAKQSLKLPTAIVTSMVNNDAFSVQDGMDTDQQIQLSSASIPISLFGNALDKNKRWFQKDATFYDEDAVVGVPRKYDVFYALP